MQILEALLGNPRSTSIEALLGVLEAKFLEALLGGRSSRESWQLFSRSFETELPGLIWSCQLSLELLRSASRNLECSFRAASFTQSFLEAQELRVLVSLRTNGQLRGCNEWAFPLHIATHYYAERPSENYTPSSQIHRAQRSHILPSPRNRATQEPGLEINRNSCWLYMCSQSSHAQSLCTSCVSSQKVLSLSRALQRTH